MILICQCVLISVLANGAKKPFQIRDRLDPVLDIQGVIKAFPTSARTVLVQTDAGKGYLKAMGGPEGPHSLVCEWVGTHLAKWFNLPTFDFALIEVTDTDEIPFHGGGKAEAGPAFITKAESGTSWSGKKRQLEKLINRQDISRLVVFDKWALNCDRHSVPEEGKITKPRINRDNVFLSEEAPKGRFLLKAMDHTHCFTCGRPLSRSLANIDRIKDPRIFGLFPEFRQYLDRNEVRRAASDLAKMSRTVAIRMTEQIPKEWDVTNEALEALRDFIVRRAAYVVETIEDQLWPQGELDFSNSGETEAKP